jgi:hypothetical protein
MGLNLQGTGERAVPSNAPASEEPHCHLRPAVTLIS